MSALNTYKSCAAAGGEFVLLPVFGKRGWNTDDKHRKAG
jgi:hypothetical protein